MNGCKKVVCALNHGPLEHPLKLRSRGSDPAPDRCEGCVCLPCGFGGGGAAGQRKHVRFCLSSGLLLLPLGVNLIFLIPPDVSRQDEAEGELSEGEHWYGNSSRRSSEASYGEVQRTISCAWRTGSKSSPRSPTPPWEATPPAATRWS